MDRRIITTEEYNRLQAIASMSAVDLLEMTPYLRLAEMVELYGLTPTLEVVAEMFELVEHISARASGVRELRNNLCAYLEINGNLRLVDQVENTDAPIRESQQHTGEIINLFAKPS